LPTANLSQGLGKPGRPKGGDAFGLRAAWAALSERFAV